VNREGAEVTSAGRSFQTRAPATENARRPTAASLTVTAGTHQSLLHQTFNVQLYMYVSYRSMFMMRFVIELLNEYE